MKTALWLYAFEHDIVSPGDVVMGGIVAVIVLAIICLLAYWLSGIR